MVVSSTHLSLKKPSLRIVHATAKPASCNVFASVAADAATLAATSWKMSRSSENRRPVSPRLMAATCDVTLGSAVREEDTGDHLLNRVNGMLEILNRNLKVPPLDWSYAASMKPRWPPCGRRPFTINGIAPR